MAQLRLGARNGAVERGDERNHGVVNEVLLDVAVREVHALRQTSLGHLTLAGLDADAMEALIQEEVERNFHKTESAQNVANVEDPAKVRHFLVAFRDPHVQSGGNNEDGHLKREEVRLEETVEQVDDAFPIRRLQRVVGDVGENTALSGLFGILLVQLRLGDVHIGGVAHGVVKRAESARGVLPFLPEFDDLSERISGVKGTPHMPHCLLVTSLHVRVNTAETLGAIATDVALTDGADDGPDGQVAVEREEALEVHVQIFSDGFVVAVPASDAVNKFQGHGVDGGGRRNRRSGVESRHATSTPKDVGNTDNGGNTVGVTVEDDWSRVHGGLCCFGVGQVHGSQQSEEVG